MKFLIPFLFLSLNLSAQITGTVKAVHDGDTYKVAFKDTTMWIRIYGVDCPEIISNHITKDQPYGRMIGDSVRTFLKGKVITVVPLYYNRWDKLVAKVYVVKDSVAIDFGEDLLKEGRAWLDIDNVAKDSPDYVRYKMLQDGAIENKWGLWKKTRGKGQRMRPSTWRKKYSK
jgi:endonuclease YncB( thermonuclease family)